MALRPTDPVTALKGIGPSLRDKLQAIGIHRVGDLLLHLPIRYEDRSTVTPLRSAMAGNAILIQAQVVESKVTYGKRRSWLVTVEDGSGFLGLRFFHFSKAQQQSLQVGMYVQAFGSPRFGASGLELTHPEYRSSAEPFTPPEPELTPVYPTTKGLGQLRIRKLVNDACATIQDHDGWPLPAIRYLHQPPADASVAQIEYQQSQIALDELTAYYLIMHHQQRARQSEETLALPSVAQLGRELQKRLGFVLTGAQKRALTDVLDDLSGSEPMLRLIQGDVGSGKTIVAAFAAIRAAEHQAQTALMAPTEILAEQHYLNFSQWLSPLGIDVVLITGSLKAKERRIREQAVADGQALVVIGTHALFQDEVVYASLGLVIIDEQHRFGVHQRLALRDKGRQQGLRPHQLVMTATPIPRTAAMTVYGDLDVSVLDELPPGRTPVNTVLISNERRDDVVARIEQACRGGSQAYWVCTLIDESDVLQAQAAEEVSRELQSGLQGISVGLVHGRMKPAEKQAVMDRFKCGEIQSQVDVLHRFPLQ